MLRTSALLLLLGCTPSALSSLVLDYAASAPPGATFDANGGVDEVWAATTSGGGPAGNFLGDSANNGFSGSPAGAGASAWALFAEPGNQSVATANINVLAGRTLSFVGDSIGLQFDNGEVTSGSRVGLRLRDSSNAVVAGFTFTGGAGTYDLLDASGTNPTPVGFTNGGLDLTLTLTTAGGGFSLDAGSTSLGGVLGGGFKEIASIEVFNEGAGPGSAYDVYFNNLSLVAVPEVSPALVMPLLAGLGVAFRGRRR